ncbi:MAG TPA: hypothetical protein VFP36_07335 [Usitatibacter sp.]|nr:hypothetical protein [Usitatibacter sp.]
MKPVLCALALLTLGACASYDGYSLRPGTSTEDEVRRTMGQPAMEFRNPDGTRELAYPRGPLGTQTFMADVGGDGVLRALRPVLDDDIFRTIEPGMTRDQVLRLIGPPGDVMEFPRMGQVSYEYRFMDSWRYLALFSVNFDRNGIVVGKFTRRIERGDGRSR